MPMVEEITEEVIQRLIRGGEASGKQGSKCSQTGQTGNPSGENSKRLVADGCSQVSRSASSTGVIGATIDHIALYKKASKWSFQLIRNRSSISNRPLENESPSAMVPVFESVAPCHRHSHPQIQIRHQSDVVLTRSLLTVIADHIGH
eukprot:gb/GECG01014809.1/.p1 GENE.gb/GECG01014809.1/~~gb/GECG01014809.1/.p1  ORF type:complete len:147 (+),score=9.37 gb/GECG01014809.1/:1-441(+)